MAQAVHNPIFKRPAGIAPPRLRSPSPPRAFVEPLSPARPTPIEPSFNYPAINSHLDFGVHPESSYNTVTPSTSRVRAYSTSYTSNHQRTPSTIDTLAEAALAATPSESSRPVANGFTHRGHSHAHPMQGSHGANEPPHKRTRSEVLPSPFVTQYASRPTTSYESYTTSVAYTQLPQTYDRRVEEAALLLNFQSGGLPNPTSPTNFTLPAANARPHAKSFPQSAVHIRPMEMNGQSSSIVLPPLSFQHTYRAPSPSSPQDVANDHYASAAKVSSPQQEAEDWHRYQAVLPSPIKTLDEHGPAHRPRSGTTNHMDNDVDREAGISKVPISMPPGDNLENEASANRCLPNPPVQIMTPPDEVDPPPPSIEVEMTESPDSSSSANIASGASVQAPPKGRRGWPKGKPRGSGARKTLAEKAATKRAATHKKNPGARSARVKNVNNRTAITEGLIQVRRKSLSDGDIFGEQERDEHDVDTDRARSVPPDIPMMIRVPIPAKPIRKKDAVTSETICAGCNTQRETNTSHGELDEWISCNGCKKWLHIDCAGFKTSHLIKDVDKYFCEACEPTHGKTTYVRKSSRAHASVDYAELQKGVLKTSEESVEHHYIQPIKDGTFQFDAEAFPRLKPEMVTRDFLERSACFIEPICIPAEWNPRPWATNNEVKGLGSSGHEHEQEPHTPFDLEQFEYDTVPDDGQDKLEMVMPEGLTVRQVCNLVGGDWPIEVIDVKTQNSGAKWTLSRWADYYEDEGAEKAIRNVISLEVSQTKLGRLLQRPKVVRDIDLQDDVWPQEEIDKGKYPKVQFYCLMSVADSYTDFHIDFGGSSVYYHILKGKKTFFFIPPTAKHLKAYEQWNDSPQQNYTFLPTITNECYRVDLTEGDTMLIPSGWIHAVWTPEDSLVIGGNFLTRMSYKNQFRVVDIEKANETPMKFRYPFFQKIMWYTVIKYLREDPLPEEVVQLFHDGKRFERELPVWADFDGTLAIGDDRSGAVDTRYYSQAEIDGLPDLLNFIFRTVMLVLGRVEGVSAEKVKRVNAAIPKGHGEPLELARQFALWVAWKRGNEDPPAWAHPDAVLPVGKDEDAQPKKLSERKLKELERKEAIAAWRIAPDRVSSRVANMAGKAEAAGAEVTSSATANGSIASVKAPQSAVANELSSADKVDLKRQRSRSHSATSPMQEEQHSPPPHQQYQQVIDEHSHGVTYASHQQVNTLSNQQPFMIHNTSLNGSQYLSTPKTSVLGPKRVACDACRKRRIRCKHKDMVQQVTSNGFDESVNGGFMAGLAGSDWYENITVTPSGTGYANANNNGENGIYDEGEAEGFASPAAGIGRGHEPQPGTNAYVNANIPMTMNGVPIFGEMPKRGRSKACYECRKSKRRCVHDENGHVDPVKAAETPVTRGSLPIKKQQSTEEVHSPLLVSKSPQPDNSASPYIHQQIMLPAPVMQGHGVLKPQSTTPKVVKKTNARTRQQSSAYRQQRQHQISNEEGHEPPIDPDLFNMYPDPQDDTGYGDHGPYGYANEGHGQGYGMLQHDYNLPSLEQIANEVLDMNGDHYQDYNGGARDAQSLGLHHPKPDENIDSAISMVGKARQADDVETRLLQAMSNSDLPFPSRPSTIAESVEIQPSTNAYTNGVQPPPEVERPKSGASHLPLYKPPAPILASPEASKRRPNGVSHNTGKGHNVEHEKSTSPTISATKRKRDQGSAMSPAASMVTNGKRMKIEAAATENGIIGDPRELEAEELRSLELARLLQQEDLGLRRRSR